MITVKTVVTDLLETALHHQSWQAFPSLTEALAGVTATAAAWKPAEQRHSIWQIVRHLMLWKRAILEALDDRPPERADLERSDWADAAGGEAAWRADVEALMSLSRDLLERARAMPEDELGRPVVWYRGWTRTQPIAVRLLRRAAHDSYHIGQIRHLRALQEG